MLVKNNINYFYFLFYFLISLVVIYFSPSFFDILENDSLSYINKENIRQSLYPTLILLFFNNYEYIVIFQIIFLSLSLGLLAISLKIFGLQQINIFIFLTIILFNLYYTSFSKTILTEAIYFSLINISISLFIIKSQLRLASFSTFFFGVAIGGIMAIKPEGLIITVILGILYFLKQQNSNKKIFFFVGLIILPISENIFFYKYNDVRSSVLDKSITGKIFLMSALSEQKQYKNLHVENFVRAVSKKSNEVQKFLANIPNPFLKCNLTADYEVVAQYQMETILGEDKDILLKIREKKINILLNLVKENPLKFLKLTISNYLAMWMPGGKQIFFDDYMKNSVEPPFFDLLENSSGNIMAINKNLLFIVMIFFVGILIVYTFLTLLSLYELFFLKKMKNFDINVITILINFHLFIISVINTATPRYLIPFFPIIIMIMLIRLNKKFK